jgi:sulfofructose kinase
MNETIDVLGLGAVAVDDLLYLDAFPVPDSKSPIKGRERQGGGLAGTALVAAARMGKTTAYAGALGDDELSRFVIDGFAAEGVGTAHLARVPGARPFHSTILVDAGAGTRTILFNQQGVIGAAPDAPPEDVVRAARVLLVDHVGLEGMVRAARIARAAGIPVVADLERTPGPLFRDLLDLSDHLILPRGFALKITGAADAAEACRALWRPDRAVVVVTASAEGCWYLCADEPGRLFHQPVFAVREVDSNGCGDVFHGAYAAFLSEGAPCAERVRKAAAVAAAKATQPGGRKGIPRRAEAEAFLAERAGEARRTEV